MSINMTFFPTEAPGTVWFEDGSSQSLDPQQEKAMQLPNGAICTVASNADSGEGSPEDKALAFAERMAAFWQSMITKARSEVRKPTATPL
jgi:hypothetical protein